MSLRVLPLLLSLSVSLCAQSPTTRRGDATNRCSLDAGLLYRKILVETFSKDEDKRPTINSDGFIRIAVHPTWDDEYFIDIRLNRKDPPDVVLYSLPKGAKSLTSLLRKAFKQHACADVKTLAARLPVKRTSFLPNDAFQELIRQFFTFAIAPRRAPADTVRLDATLYDVEFLGDETLVFSSDDYDSPVVKWIQAVVRTTGAGPAK